MGNRISRLGASASDQAILEHLCSCTGTPHVGTQRCAGVWMIAVTSWNPPPGPHGEKFIRDVGWRCSNLVCGACTSRCHCPKKLLCKDCIAAPVGNKDCNYDWYQLPCTKCWRNRHQRLLIRKNRAQIDAARALLAKRARARRGGCGRSRASSGGSDS